MAMTKYQLVIEFEVDDEHDDNGDAFVSMLTAAYVQIQDAEGIETSAATMHLLRQQEPKWELLW